MREAGGGARARRRRSLADAAAGMAAELLYVAALAALGLAVAAVATLVR